MQACKGHSCLLSHITWQWWHLGSLYQHLPSYLVLLLPFCLQLPQLFHLHCSLILTCRQRALQQGRSPCKLPFFV